MSNQLKGLLFVVLADFLWGLSAAVVKYLFNQQMSPFDLVQIRLTLSFVLLAACLAAISPGLLKIDRRDVLYMVLFGVFGTATVQFTYLFTISKTNVATAVFLQYLAPVFILLYGLITRREKAGTKKLLALFSAIGGGLLIVKGTTGSGMVVTVQGLISGLGAAAAFAFYTLYGQYGLTKYSPWTLLTWGMGAGSLVWVIYKPPWVTFSSYGGTDWIFFIYVAVFATIIPFGFFFTALKYLPPLIVGITSTMEPVMAGVLSYLILGEALTPVQVAGCAMIILAVVMLQFSNSRKDPNL